MDFINVNINKKLYKYLKYIAGQRKKELKQHKNAGTIYPIYIVQDEYERIINTKFENGGTEVIYAYNTNEITKFYNKEDVIDYIKNELEDSKLKEDILTKLNDEYITLEKIASLLEKNEIFRAVSSLFVVTEYKDKAYFLTREEAEEYINRQSHNLNNPIVFVKYPGYSNESYFEKMLKILDEENSFVEKVDLSELDKDLQQEYFKEVETEEKNIIYLCAVCSNQITTREEGICSACQDHEEFKNGDYEDRDRIIVNG